MSLRTVSCILICVGSLSAASPEKFLCGAAENAGILIGAAVRHAQLSEPAYANTLFHEFNLLSPKMH